jgi:hypothetical protein
MSKNSNQKHDDKPIIPAETPVETSEQELDNQTSENPTLENPALDNQEPENPVQGEGKKPETKKNGLGSKLRKFYKFNK